jgi:hypothetical protein
MDVRSWCSIPKGPCSCYARSVPQPKLNLGLRIFFSEFVRVSLRRPSQAAFFARTILWQAAAARRRAQVAAEGITVPLHRHIQYHQWVLVTVSAQGQIQKVVEG